MHQMVTSKYPMTNWQDIMECAGRKEEENHAHEY